MVNHSLIQTQGMSIIASFQAVTYLYPQNIVKFLQSVHEGVNSNDEAQVQEKRLWMANVSVNKKIITHLKVQKCVRVHKGVNKLALKTQVAISTEFDDTVDEGIPN